MQVQTQLRSGLVVAVFEAGSCRSSNLTPGLGTSIRLGEALKKKKKKRYKYIQQVNKNNPQQDSKTLLWAVVCPSLLSLLASLGVCHPHIPEEVSHLPHSWQLESIPQKVWAMKHFLTALLKLCPQDTQIIHPFISQSIDKHFLGTY